MGCLVLGAAGFLMFAWWFATTYGDPAKILLFFVGGSLVLALWAGFKLGQRGRDDR